MNLVKRNLGNFVLTILPLIIIPIYLKNLGKAEYGLFGFYATLQTMFIVLDLGLGATINRELARFHDAKQLNQYINDLFKTFDIIYWGIAIFVGVSIWAFSPIIVNYINSNELNERLVFYSVLLMGLLLLFRWPIVLYTNGLLGIQKQVIYNIIYVCVEIAKSFTSVIVLVYFTNSLEVFFYLQILFRRVLTKGISYSSRFSKFDLNIIKHHKPFLSGVLVMTLIAVVLTQIDKILLVRYVPISTFGYYTLAFMIATSVSRVSTPIGQTYYPQFVNSIQQNNHKLFADLYHKSSQLVAIVIIPACLIMCFFAKELLFLWTSNIEMAEKTHMPLSILAIGTMATSLFGISNSAQLALGWTKLIILQNIISGIILIPLLIILIPKYGMIAAALFYAVSNLINLFIGVPLMFKKILRGEFNMWIIHDILKPLVLGLSIVGLFRVIFNALSIESRITILIFISMTGLFSLLAIALCYSFAKNIIWRNFKKFKFIK